MTILCLASYVKGQDFLRAAKALGCRVLLLTSESVRDTPEWPPPGAVDETFYTADDHKIWNRNWVLNQVAWLMRTHDFDRIVALDDFDVEVAAMLREHLRVPGMGETTVRYFRDKLAMRTKAREEGLNVPEFCGIFNYSRVAEFMDRVPGPWLLKPRSMAGAIGIKKIARPEELWTILEVLGDMQSHYLLEQFVPGDIFHVDTVMYENEIRFAVASGYGRPPLEVSHEGGIFTTRILDRNSVTAKALLAANARVLAGFGLVRGVSHTEFIRAHSDGRIHFLETSARVGGAHIADLVEAATGLNLWAEWARVEVAGGTSEYTASPLREDYAGLLVSLARQESPDTSAYNDPEIVWRMQKEHHVGLIARSPSEQRVLTLLADYTRRVQHDFHASAPPRESPSH